MKRKIWNYSSQTPRSYLKKFDDYTQEERVELMRTDIKAYLAIVTMDHLVGVLDGIAKSGAHSEIEEET